MVKLNVEGCVELAGTLHLNLTSPPTNGQSIPVCTNLKYAFHQDAGDRCAVPEWQLLIDCDRSIIRQRLRSGGGHARDNSVPPRGGPLRGLVSLPERRQQEDHHYRSLYR